MTIYVHSIVAIIPADLVPACVEALAALGFAADPTVRLSASGAQPATHMGLHTPETDAFVAKLAAARGVPELAALLDACTVSVRDVGVDPVEHFDEVAAAAGLQRVAPPTPTPAP